ncbi:MAG TPA: hypothetical protein VGG53_01815 [Mycobacterium sp.]|jgi:hypothetical protein|uniref:hypothetical protein n=1 Tax=Mycobacterium sp. TaxID=1785 RepID=UPI002F3E5E88
MGKSIADKLARVAAEAEAGEADQTDRPLPAHVKVSQPGRARSKVLQIRLNPDELAAVEAIAERRGLPVSTVGREQILQLIAEDAATQADAPAAVLSLSRLLGAAEMIKEYADQVRDEMPTELNFPGMTRIRSPKRPT